VCIKPILVSRTPFPVAYIAAPRPFPISANRSVQSDNFQCVSYSVTVLRRHGITVSRCQLRLKVKHNVVFEEVSRTP
jgi:hypothetical protein